MTVAVVGDGLAAATAALAAARHRDGHVRLVSEGGLRMDHHDGPLDVLGHTGADGPVSEPLAALGDLPADHPYSQLGPEPLREGLALFDELTGDRYLGGDDERNGLVPTQVGRLRPAARYPRGVAPGLASRERRTTLVGLTELTAFDAPLAATRLQDRLPYEVWGTTVDFPSELPATPGVLDAAERIQRDHEESGAGRLAEGLRDALAGELVFDGRTDRRVGLPPVLGLAAADSLRAAVGRRLNATVFEVPTGAPSPLGRRLGDRVRAALREAGVELDRHAKARATVEDGRVTDLRLDDGEEASTVGVEAVVLATGGVGRGGLVADRPGLCEPVADCPVQAPTSRLDWSAPDPLADQPFARAGVRTDADPVVPVTTSSRPVAENLFVAGRLLAGFDPVAELSGDGVALATGLVAGRRAAERATTGK